MPSRGLPSFIAVAALLVAGMAVPPSTSAAPVPGGSGAYDDPAFASSPTVAVQGTLTTAEIESLGRAPSHTTAHAVTTDDGFVVPVTLTEEHPPNSSFSGELVLEGELAETLDSEGLLPRDGQTIDGDSAAGQAALAAAQEQATPLPVAEATVIAPGETSQTVTPAAHRAYVVKMVDQGSVDGTNAEIAAKVDNMLAFWTTESDGAITSFTRQGAILDYDSSGDVPAAQGCGIQSPFAVWDDAAKLFPGVNLNAAGNHLIVLIGEECGKSGPVGVATVGAGLSSGGPSILTYDPQTFAATGAHELGHNFGLQHANLDSCPTTSICEYYDFYSPMGISVGAAPVFTPTALGTLYRAELDLVTPAEVTNVASPQAALTQSFSLAPRSSSSGLRGLLVTDPSTGTTYSVDWRSHTGRDAGAFYGNTLGYAFAEPVPAYPSGVVIERQSGRADTFLMTQTVGGRQTGSFATGNTFSPSPRLSIAVGSIGATAGVTVSIAAPTDVPSAVPTFTGTAAVGQLLTAQPGAWATGTTIAYDWKIDGVSTGVTTRVFQVPDTAAGKQLTLSITGSKPGFSTVTRTSVASVVERGTLTAATPAISGTPAVGSTVTAQPGTWTSGTTFAYDWKLDGVSTGVTTAALALPGTAAGKALTVEVTGSRTGYSSASRTSAAATVAMGTLVTSAPALDKAPVVDETVTVLTGSWTSGTVFAYDWLLDGTSTGVTTPSFDVPDNAAGKALAVKVTGMKPGYVTESRTTPASTIGKQSLVTSVPTLSGTPTVGEQVSARPGTWTAGTSFAYDWKLGGISTGVTGSTFDVPPSAAGEQLTVEVTGTKSGYATASRTSVGIAVAKGSLTAATPTISGTVAVGEQVTAETGVWTGGTSFTYDWMIDGDSTGVTTRTFDVPSTAVTKQLSVTVTGTRTGYATASKTSDGTAVAAGNLTSATPTIAGTAAVGEQVAAEPGSWTSGTTFAYDWKVDGESTGVVTSTFDVPAAAAGKALTVEVTGSKTGYTPVSRISTAATIAKGTLATSEPTLDKSPVVDETVTVVSGPWTPGTSFTYDWQLDGTSTGVDTNTFDVPAAAAGQDLAVVVTGTKSGYDAASRTTSASTVAQQRLTASTPTLSGVPTVGEVVTAEPGTWTAGTSFTYAWQVDGGPTGVTTRTFDVPASAAGKQLTVEVTGSKDGYASSSRTSVAVGVAVGALSSAVPTIEGSVAVGQEVTAATGAWTSGTSFTYDWLVDGASTGVTTSTFAVPASAAGSSLTVEVTGVQPGYAASTRSSVASTVAAGKLVGSVPNIVGTVAVGRNVVAEPLFWTSGTTFAYDWLIDGVSTGVPTQTFEIPDTALDAELTVQITGSKPGYASATLSSAPSAVTKGTLASTKPALDKTPVVDEMVTAVTGSWTSGTSFTYDWKVDGISTGVATQTFDVTAAAAGKPLTVTVTGTRKGYHDAALTSAESTVQKRTLATSAPTIVGQVAAGRTVTSETGSWTSGTTFAYDWKVDGVSTGGTAATFDVPAAMVGKSLTLEVTGTKSGYEPAARTSPASVIGKGLLATAVPTIVGKVVVDGSVTVDPGLWAPGPDFAYDWKLDGVSTGVSAKTFVVPASAAGGSLTVDVTGTKAGYETTTESSSASTVAAGDLASSDPTITGTAAVGKSVVAEPGFWSSGTTFAFDWMIDGRSTGVTTPTFSVPDTAAGKELSVAVTGSKPGYTTTARTSGASAVSNGTLDSSVPSLDGSAAVDETVTAVPGAWTTGTAFAYDWMVDGISTGVSTKTFDIPATALGKELSVTVTGSRAGYDPAARTSAAVTVEQQVLVFSTPTLTGTPRVGRQITAEPGTWTAGTAFAYDWMVDGVSTGVSTKTFDVPATAAGQQLAVAVTGTKSGYADLTKRSTGLTVADGALSSSVPTISGTIAVGRAVRAQPGTWTPGTSFAYDWMLDGESTGATTQTFDIPDTAAGAELTVEVTGTKAGYEPAATTSAASVVADGELDSSVPDITGTVAVGRTVVAEPGAWTAGTRFAFRWLVDGEPTGVTTQTFDVPDSAAGAELTVEVTGTKPGYAPAARTSTPSTVANGTLKSAVPTLDKAPVVDETVTAVTGSWTSGTDLAFDWLVDGESTGVTTQTFAVPDTAAGAELAVEVTGTRSGYHAATVSSVGTIVSEGVLASSVPTIFGAPAVGRTVTADPGAWTSGTGFTYDWRVDGDPTGVTTQTFEVPDTALGAELTVTVTGARTGYLPATESSVASTVVEGTLESSIPSLDKAPVVDQAVTVVTGSWTSGTSFTYSWMLDGTPTGVTTPTFDVPGSAAGAALTVEVTGTRSGYAPSSRTSVGATVANAGLLASVPIITGTVKVGKTVWADPGLWGSGTTFAYDWLVDGVSTGIGSQMFDVPDSAAGADLTVKVTGMKPGYTPRTESSAAATVANGTLVSSEPTVDGRMAVDETVTVVPFSWTPGTALTYDWKIDGLSTGVDTETFLIPDTAAGKRLTVTVTGTRAGYDSAARTSEERTVAKQVLRSAVPTVKGAPVVGGILTADPGTWTAGTAFTFSWLIDGVPTGITTGTFAIPDTAVGARVTVEVTGTKRGYDTVTQGSDATVIEPGELATSKPIVVGTVAAGQTVTVEAGAWTPGTTFTRDWLLDGVSTGVDSSTFDIPDTAAGALLTVEVTGTRSGYSSATETSVATIVADGALVSSVPNIVGPVAVGRTVIAEPGFWTSGTTFAYDWKLDGATTGVTTKTYDVPDTAVGKSLTVTVTGTRTGHAAATRHSAASPVRTGTLEFSDPTIEGAVAIDQTVTAKTGSWTNGTVFAYDWRIDGISTGVSSASFDIPGTALGKSLTLAVTGTRAGYDAKSRTSLEVTVAGQVLVSSKPTMSGTPMVGMSVTAEPGDWTVGTSFTYDWQLDGLSTGVTSRTYDVPASAAGSSLAVRVTGSRSGYAAVLVLSDAQTVARGVLTAGQVAISGAPKVGAVVTANEGSWTPGSALTYAWFSGGTLIGTNRALAVPASAVGQGLRLVVTGASVGYESRRADAVSGPVAAGSMKGAAPRVTGTARVGKTLKVKVGSWSPRPTYRYQWYANGKKITKKGNKSSFKVTSKQKGKKITVRVTGSKSGYVTVTKASRSTKKVARKKK